MKYLLVILLLLVNGFLLNPATSYGQTTSSSDLTGTRWKATTDIQLGGGNVSHTDFDYHFTDDKTVKVVAVSVLWGRLPQGLIPAWGILSKTTVQQVGTYNRSGQNLTIEFHGDHRIKALIDGNRAAGTFRTQSGIEAAWSAERISVQSEMPLTKDAPNANLFGPWKTEEGLHSAILDFFVKRFDEIMAADMVTDQAQIQQGKDLYFGQLEKHGFAKSEYELVAKGIAHRLNAHFGGDAFKPSDFTPPQEPKDDSVLEGMRATDERYLYKISRYINEIYLPAVRRVLKQ